MSPMLTTATLKLSLYKSECMMSSMLTSTTLKLSPYKSEGTMSSMFTAAMPKLSGYRSERRDIACRGVLWLVCCWQLADRDFVCVSCSCKCGTKVVRLREDERAIAE